LVDYTILLIKQVEKVVLKKVGKVGAIFSSFERVLR
jgi:hypothetical protein